VPRGVKREMGAERQFWCAWIEDTNALVVWDLVVRTISTPVWAVVTMLDSNERIAELTAIGQLIADGGQVELLGDAVLFDSDAFARLRVHGDNFFTGYDEIWMTREICASLAKPSHLRISAEQTISDAPAPGLGRWMEANGLCVGIGDGFGANVATRDSSVMRILTQEYGEKIHVADAEASW
jgi:hypothetical protein